LQGVVISLKSIGLPFGYGVGLGACASVADTIAAVYVSPIQYENYRCQQLAAEAERVSRRAAELYGVQDSKASNGAVATTAAIILLWPAAFLVKGDGQTAAELGRMKGEFETVEKVSIEKKCSYQFRAMEPPAAKRKRAAT
jgi:hypothetical protein